MDERTIYKLLSYVNWYKALSRGPEALLRRELRIIGYRLVNGLIGNARRRP